MRGCSGQARRGMAKAPPRSTEPGAAPLTTSAIDQVIDEYPDLDPATLRLLGVRVAKVQSGDLPGIGKPDLEPVGYVAADERDARRKGRGPNGRQLTRGHDQRCFDDELEHRWNVKRGAAQAVDAHRAFLIEEQEIGIRGDQKAGPGDGPGALEFPRGVE